jgi:hypothetical protein
MRVFKIDSPDEGLGTVLDALATEGIRTASRNGPVLRFAEPVCLAYQNPQRRVLTSPVRDANPFFHLVETMWMFAGLQELEPLLRYNAGMAQYSDDGTNLRGTAYGHRWRSYTWGDQLGVAVDTLRTNPEDRRVVVTMWDPLELGGSGKDFACNLQVIFGTRPLEAGGYALDMTVTNRSNDIVYGAMGSNLFHFSMLLEYMAYQCDMAVGKYYQVSNNLHLYTENPTSKRCLEQRGSIRPAVAGADSADATLSLLGLTIDPAPIADYVRKQQGIPDQPYLQQVVMPLVEAYRVFKLKSLTGLDVDATLRVRLAQSIAAKCASPQLAAAATSWLERKLPKDNAAKLVPPDMADSLRTRSGAITGEKGGTLMNSTPA